MMRQFLLALTLAAPVFAADWPGWRGPTGMGQSPESSLPVVWGGKDNQNVRWRAPLYSGSEKVRFDQDQSSPIAGSHLTFTAQTSSIVTIDQNGVATAQQPGSTIVSANLTNAGSTAGFFSTCPPTSIALNVPGTNGGTSVTSTSVTRRSASQSRKLMTISAVMPA